MEPRSPLEQLISVLFANAAQAQAEAAQLKEQLAELKKPKKA